MHEGAAKRAILPGLAAVASIAAGCAGDMPAPDGPRVDAFTWDVVRPTDQRPAGEALLLPDGAPRDAVPVDGQPADRGVAADATATPAACASWSAWACELDAVLLCRATCAAGPLQLSCINSGACVCGVSTGPCGTFSAADPCDVCRQAVEADCCNK